MKVKCNRVLSPVSKEDLGEKSSWLTRDKEYVVLAMTIRSDYGIQIYIQSDHYNEPTFFNLDGFGVINQYIPSCWITPQEVINGITYTYIMPKSWAHLDFYSDIEAENIDAIILFNEVTEQINNEENNYKPLYKRNKK